MLNNALILVTFCLCPLALTSVTSSVYHDYCVIGAGPSGLQIGHYLQRAGRDYVIFEKSNQSGNFFQLYPRHRKLISINKRFTGQHNAEFNMRHDWNSLLSDDDTLVMTRYSKDMFPHADTLLKYLDDYTKRLSIHVQYQTEISDIRSVPNATAPDGHVYNMADQTGQAYICRTLIVATGIATPNIPKMEGIEYAEGYEDVSIDADDYEGKSVLILGRGNAAFEMADQIYGSTNLIHMVARSRVRLAWATHYVGDLRAVNNGLLDTYQLKSLDGVFESPVTYFKLEKKGGKIYALHAMSNNRSFDNNPIREPYDVVVRALGFTFDASIFNATDISRGKRRTRKYPAIHHNYESVDQVGLFYAGTATHSLDFRKSAGGFIHGFRYTARALHRLLEWRYERVSWPHTRFPITQLLNTIIKRINEASGIYQMFSVLGDVAIFSEDGQTIQYLEEYPLNLLDSLTERSGIKAGSVLVISMEYGQDFSGPGKDIFRGDRAVGAPNLAHFSNFLHPVIYHYKSLPTADQMASRGKYETLPRPDRLHHIVEDFLTQWDGQTSHVLPLRRFLEKVRDADQRNFFAESCFRLAMTHASLPETCAGQYMKGAGLTASEFGTSSSSSRYAGGVLGTENL